MPSSLSMENGGATRPQRVLACVLCQQRKVKCDRKSPCKNCTKSRAQCVPAKLTPRRRRRNLPERELLDGIRGYENLLRDNGIQFEPILKDYSGRTESLGDDNNLSDDEEGSDLVSTHAKINTASQSRTMWQTLGDSTAAPKDTGFGAVIKNAWESLGTHDSDFIFAAPRSTVNLSSLRPGPVLTFRLWQVYLDNVHPLMKVTHTPTLQPRIISMTSDPENIDPALDALMFGIYCMSIFSLEVDECQAIFGLGSSKDNVLLTYQSACQQALSNCNFLWTDQRECLTAFLLYLISTQPSTNPRELSSILGLAIRIAQRMGIHSESLLLKHTPFEAEMRRRLWWALILFDTRVGEIANDRNTLLSALWDCKVPLNVNDSDLWEEMKEAPVVSGEQKSDAMLAVARSEMADVVRGSGFYRYFTSMSGLQKMSPPKSGGELAVLEKMIENIHLRSDPANRLHFTTIWMGRKFLARCCLLDHMHSQYSSGSPTHDKTDKDYDTALSHALSMLYSDTKLLSSPLTKGFRWMNHLYFPLFAYMHIADDLKWRPTSALLDEAWQAMSANFEARSANFEERFAQAPKVHGHFFKIFTTIITQAWEVRQETARRTRQELTTPKIIGLIENVLERLEGEKTAQTVTNDMSAILNSFPLELPVGLSNHNPIYRSQWHPDQWTPTMQQPQPQMDLNHMDWWGMT